MDEDNWLLHNQYYGASPLSQNEMDRISAHESYNSPMRPRNRRTTRSHGKVYQDGKFWLAEVPIPNAMTQGSGRKGLQTHRFSTP
jgi:hypothetical protein